MIRLLPTRFAFRAGLLTALGLGLHTACQAQIGLLALAVTNLATTVARADHDFYRHGPGSYQLPGAQWQPEAELRVSNTGMVVGKKKDAQHLRLDQFSQIVVNADSFVVMHNVLLGGSGKVADSPLLGQRVWRHPQVELFHYRAMGGTAPMLRFPDQTVVVLPRNTRDFSAAMLKLVGDQPMLAEQLRQGGLESSYIQQILTSYLEWKPSGFNTASLKAAAN
ncbi:hypothetical protein GCM10027048_24900 [Hymenobacter coalescens]